MLNLREARRRRYLFLCDLGNEVFGRVKSDFHHLLSRTMSLISVNLAILTIILTVVYFWLQAGWHPSEVDFALLYLFAGFLLISLVINILILSPTNQGLKEFIIFNKEERLEKLLVKNEEALYGHFLFYLQKAIEDNSEKYEKLQKYFLYTFYFFIGANIILTFFVFKNLIIKGV